MPMEVNRENYYSTDANREYMSVSQYKDFLTCPVMAMAKINGIYQPEPTTEFLVGSYIHSWNDGTIEQFKVEHPEMFSSKGPTKGELKAPFKFADQMIATLEADPFCMFVLQGEKEVIMTANLFGVPWKIRMDTYNSERQRIVDLKTTRNIRELVWSAEEWRKVSFIEAYKYVLQMAVYCEIERIATNQKLWAEPLIVAVSKEDPPDKEIISLLDEPRFEEELYKVETNMPQIIAVKHGGKKPKRCGKCAYCRSTKKIETVLHYTQLEEVG